MAVGRCRKVVSASTAVMPLNTVPSPLELSSYEGINANFVIFYASRDESGRMWCPVRWFPRSWLAESLPRRPLGAARSEALKHAVLGLCVIKFFAYVSPVIAFCSSVPRPAHHAHPLLASPRHATPAT